MTDSKDLAVVSGNLAIIGDAEAMKAKLAVTTECRKVVTEYISENFVPGVDFGPTDDRSKKKTLKKPGAEKICGLFNTRPTWTRDEDTWEMLGRPPGTVCYVCHIIDNATGKIVGEGRGAETVGNKSRDANKTIKNAEKCALVDAALYTFRLSELFTQDDGGNGGSNPQASLDTMKAAFMTAVQAMRMGQNTDMTDLRFIRRVVEQELHKTKIDSVGEMEAISKVVLEDKLFDLATGEKIPA